MTPEHLRRLAELEWRSRTSAWPAYTKAGIELGDKVSLRDHTAVRDAVVQVLARWQLPIEPATLASQAIEQAALCALMADRLSKDSRMILGRSWRAALKELSESP